MTVRLSVALRSVSVQRGEKWALRELSWELRPGERWALIGDNGAGKTQLLKLIAGDVWPTPTRSGEAPDSGRLYRAGAKPVALIDAKARVAYVGGEQQDKYARHGWNLTVRDVIATGLHRTDLLLQPVTSAEANRVGRMLRTCGVTRLAGREFLSLSYGEKRLTLLGRALVQEPDWLLLDEFYNGLDADYRRRLGRVLDAARRGGQSWVATAHRAMDVPRGTQQVLELADGRAVSMRRLGRADFAGLVRRAGEPAARRKRTATALTSAPALALASVRSASRGKSLIELRGVDLFVEYRPVLKDVHWQLRRGEHWAIYGANGAGKSSFLKLLYGDLAPALGGSIERAGFPFGTPISEWKRQIGYVTPELQTTYLVDVSIFELVASGRHSSIGLVDPPTREDTRVANRWLKFFQLAAVAARQPRELSYGQLRRALVARAMAASPRLLLLDEPLTGLDPQQRALMKRLLQRLMRRHVSVVAAVHHAEDLPRGMTHGLRLHKRRASPTDSYSAT